MIGIGFCCLLPKRLDGEEDEEEEEEIKDIPYWRLFTNQRTVMIIICACVNAINMMFLEPLLSLRIAELGLDDRYAGVGWALEALTYTIGSILFARVIDKYELDPRVVVLPCLVMCCPAIYFLSGYWPPDAYLLFVGLGLDGFFMSGVAVTLYTEVTADIEEKFLDDEEILQLKDKMFEQEQDQIKDASIDIKIERQSTVKSDSKKGVADINITQSVESKDLSFLRESQLRQSEIDKSNYKSTVIAQEVSDE